jgi:CRP-like cAMP-binding protein
VSAAADLVGFGPFSDLTPGERDLLVAAGEEQALKPGEVLCLEGSEADGAILLLDGALDCARDGAGELPRIEAPAALGLAALAWNGNREAKLVAAGPTRVLLITRNGFHRFSQDAPAAAVRVLEGVVGELAGVLRGSLELLVPPRG